MTLLFLALLLPSEASCKSQILTAKAVVEDVGAVAAAHVGISLWSKCSVSHSERAVQTVMERQMTKLPIPVSHMVVKGIDIPWLSPRDTLTWIVERGLWPTLAGAGRNEHYAAMEIWRQFWHKYRTLHPDFGLFHMDGVEELDLGVVAALCIHGDEGTSLKKQGIMICSLQSMLGKGFDDKRVPRRGNDGMWHMRVNFAGHSATHRLLMTCMPKKLYESEPEVFRGAVENVALALKDLLSSGIKDPAGNRVYRFVVLATKGDAPFLTKIGRFYRSYNTTVKRGEERKVPKGVCHRCLAGTPGYPAEELSTRTPRWLQTSGVKMPWVEEPHVIRHLLHDLSDPSSFFQSDVWHVVHLGFGKAWVASIVFLLLEVLPGGNMEQKYEHLSSRFLAWCRQTRRQAHIHAITPYLMSHNDHTGLMGNWHKGALTTSFLQFMVDFIPSLPADRAGALRECLEATKALNTVFSTMFRAEAFLSADEAKVIADAGFAFLACYAKQAQAQFGLGRPHAFPLYPKLHAFHEVLINVEDMARRHGFCLNPICFSCQMDEDAIGRTARLSRVVSSRKTMFRTIGRWLVQACTAFREAGLIS